MEGLTSYIREVLQAAIPDCYDKAMVYCEVTPDYRDGFIRYTVAGENSVKQSVNWEDVASMIARVWKTVKSENPKKLWNGIIYILDGDKESYELLYRDEFNFDMGIIELDKKLRDKYFDGMPIERISSF